MNTPSYQDIFANELELWRAKGARIIDVREPYEYQQGRVPGAENIPLYELEAAVDSLNGGIVLVCASGGRSVTAAKYLTEIGKTGIANLIGGTFGYAQQYPLES